MSRVKRSVVSRARHHKTLKRAKGFRGRAGSVIRVARIAVDRAAQYAYRDRRTRKRAMRALWIARINAAARAEGMTYARFMAALAREGVALDRKSLAALAVDSPDVFRALVERARAAT